MGWLGKRGGRSWLLTVAVLAVAGVLAVWMWVSGGAGHLPPAARLGTPAPGTITTVAGGIRRSGPATRVPLSACSVSYARGALYAGDEAGVVRRISERTGWLTTPVGGDARAAWSNRGLAATAALGGAATRSCAVVAALDPAGNLLVAAHQNYVAPARTGTFYRRPMIAGHIYPIPGSGGMRADRWGNLVTIFTDVIACNCGDTPGMVRVFAERTGVFYGMAMRAGGLYTVAGNDGQEPVPAHAGNGGPGPRAALGDLNQLALDGAGNLLIADDGRTDTLNRHVVPSQIRVVAARDGEFYGQRMRAGYIYAIAGGGHLTGNGVPASRASLLALGVAVDAAGNVVIGDTGRLRVVAVRDGEFYDQRMRAGDIYTVAGTKNSYRDSGDGGPALKARIGAMSTAVDMAGNLVFTDGASGTIRAVAPRSGTFYGIAMKAGHVYRIAGTGKPAPLSGPATEAPLPAPPAGVASDSSGDLVIGFSDTGPLFVPARAGTYFGVRMRAGDIYRIPTAASGLGRCSGEVAADRSGNVLIADQAKSLVLVAPPRSGVFYGRRMRAGRIYPVAGDGDAAASGDGRPAGKAGFSPLAVAADRRGDMIIVDNSGNFQVPGNRIKMVAAHSGTFFGITMKAGHIYTVAGDGNGTGRGEAPIADGVPATRTAVEPFGATVDAAGNLVLASDYRVRVVAARSGRFYGIAMRAGYIYTIAGPFRGSRDVALGLDGNILDLDAASAVVRLVAARSGTFYGRQVSAGQVVTVAGHNRAVPAGNTPATQAWLDRPQAIAVGPGGRLLITDQAWDRIGSVSP
jgi:hypothetical protein